MEETKKINKKIVWIKHHVKERTCDVCYCIKNKAGFPVHTVEHFKDTFHFDYDDLDRKINNKELKKGLWMNFINFLHLQIRRIDRGLIKYKRKKLN